MPAITGLPNAALVGMALQINGKVEISGIKRLVALVMLLLSTFSMLAHGVGLNPEPIIRVDNGVHSGPILWAEPYLDDSRIATASHDRTLRIWRARDLKPLQALRVPIETEREGKLNFGTASPDGSLLAAGGWTCWDWEQKGCVYLFDTLTGKLAHRIGGLPNIIGNLAFSPDGKVLAVGMHGNGGVAFIDTRTFAVVGQDREYGERVTGLAFSSNGYTVAGALDGYLRIYDPSFKLAARIQIPDVKLIGATYFSHDHSKLLVGAYDGPSVHILSFPQLQVERVLTLPKEKEQTSLRNAIWSRSGKFIYAIGDSNDTHEARIFRWLVTNPDRYETIKVATHRVQSIRPYGQNGLVFSTEDASIGIVDDSGKIARLSDSSLAEFPQMSAAFRITPDGNSVTIPLNQTADRQANFDVRRLSLNLTDSVANDGEIKRSQSPQFQLTNCRNSLTPVLNGVKLVMEPFEYTRSYALAPNRLQAYIGTEWALRAYDKSGMLRWRSATSGVVWNAIASEDGRWVLAALSDGTVRWYRASDGKEALALFIDRRTQEWVLWRPDGYYASSESGDNLIGWHVNRGKDVEPDFYRAVQFERQFYRPDLLQTQIADSLTITKKAAGSFSIHQINDIAPPRIRIESSLVNDSGEIEITVAAEKISRPMQDVTVYANLLPVASNRERRLEANETAKFRRTFRFPASSGDNLIRVEVNNGVSLGLTEQWVEAPAMKQVAPPKGDLYVLSVGVNRFDHISAADKSQVPNLRYAVNDATKLAELLQNSIPKPEYNQVHVRLLADSSQDQPTRQNILEALRFFEQVEPNDTALLFLASHGLSDKTGNYYFLPQDGELPDVDAVQSGRNLTGKAASLLRGCEKIS
jgi:WD40 repeat protein